MRLWVFVVGALLAPKIFAAERVPAWGMELSSADKAALSEGISQLRDEIAKIPAANPLLPDVKIFLKAVDWAVSYREIYRTNEIQIAHKLIAQGVERSHSLAQGKSPWAQSTGLVIRAYVSRIDDSIQPYGLVVPPSFAPESKRKYRLDVWLHGRDNVLTELKFLNDRQRSYGEFAPPDTLVLHPYGRYCNAFKFAGETDVFEAMEHVKKFYRIDEKRVALRGFSMGGAGVWHLAAHHPGAWAVAAPGAGFAETAEYQKLGPNRATVPSWEQKLWQ